MLCLVRLRMRHRRTADLYGLAGLDSTNDAIACECALSLHERGGHPDCRSSAPSENGWLYLPQAWRRAGLHTW